MAKYLPLLIRKWCLGDYVQLCGPWSYVLKFILAASSHLICPFKPSCLKKRTVSSSSEGLKLLPFQDTEQRRGVFWQRRHCHAMRSASLLHRGKLSLSTGHIFACKRFLCSSAKIGVCARDEGASMTCIFTLEQLQLFDKVDTWAEVTPNNFITSWIGGKKSLFCRVFN